jgi:putative flippase GtrA
MPLLERSAWRYLVVGAGNTLVGLLVIYLGMYAMELGDVAANALGYAVGIVLGFVLNRSWTFGHRGSMLPALGRFLLVLAIAYAANLAVVVFIADHLHGNRYVAQAIGIIPYTLIGYIGSRFFAFGRARTAGTVRGRS